MLVCQIAVGERANFRAPLLETGSVSREHRREHGVRVIGEVAAGDVEVLPREVRGADAVVAGGEFGFLGEFFEFLDEDGAVRQPERQAGAYVVVEGEEFEFLAELAVVALFRLLEHGELGVHLGLVFEGGAVDALELRVLLVALVIGAGDVGELERADVAGAHDMRAGAEVGEIAVAVDGDFLALGDALDDIEFEFARLGPRAERAEGAGLRPFAGPRRARAAMRSKGWFALTSFFISASMRLEVLGGDAMREIEVVVEAVSTGGPAANWASGQMRRMAVASTCAAEWRRRSMSDI